jgi:MoxR-like ATPase
VVKYAVALARTSRPSSPDAPDFVKDYVSWGAGPRASQFLVLAGKARAILDGRFAVAIEDVRALARPTLQHRLILNYRAEAEGVKPATLVDRLLAAVQP